MAGSTDTNVTARGGTPAPLPRLFGWLMLAGMAAFLVNVVLTVFVGVPGLAPVLWGAAGETNVWTWIQAALYAGLLAAAAGYVLRSPGGSLRADAVTITGMNTFLIRAAFWVVLLVGVADMAISFLRVEQLLPPLVGDQIAEQLSRSNFRGQWVHVPVAIVGILIACLTRGLGFIWLALLVVIAELLIVFSRFVFSYEQAFMADLVRFWYAALFLFASAYTLLEDGHVRVDVFYAGFRRRSQGRVNAWGAVLLGVLLCWSILLTGMWDARSIINSPLLVFETTQTGFGMYVKYFMAGFLALFAVSMMLQFIASMFDAIADMRGDPGGQEDHHVSHVA